MNIDNGFGAAYAAHRILPDGLSLASRRCNPFIKEVSMEFPLYHGRWQWGAVLATEPEEVTPNSSSSSFSDNIPPR
jgi:hypothetical protein